MAWALLGADGRPYESDVPGTLGGHRRGRRYGRLDCPAALRAIARGGYVAERVFFADEATAIAAGYRPCAACLPARYQDWKSARERGKPFAPRGRYCGRMTTLYQVDAFAARPFEGNPAAVVPLDAPADEAWMQAVAMEMNLSETAFLHPEGDGWRLRWFTPLVEVDLCGHATLASAHVLWEAGMLAAGDPARFETRSGRLTCTREGGWITMDFPADPPIAAPPASGVLNALGVDQPVFAGRSSFDAFVVLDSEAAVRRCAPDMAALAACTERGAIVTAPADDTAFDFVSRFFAPAVGIDEDPVTGSAHCALAVYWAGRLGRDELTGRQVSRRGGTVRIAIAGDRVRIGGQAVTVLRGDLSA